MKNTESASLMENACELLYILGVTANLKGFLYATFHLKYLANENNSSFGIEKTKRGVKCKYKKAKSLK